MKKIFLFIFTVFTFYLSAQSIVGGSGNCMVNGNPNSVLNLQTINQKFNCAVVIDSTTGDHWIYKVSLVQGSRWENRTQIVKDSINSINTRLGVLPTKPYVDSSVATKWTIGGNALNADGDLGTTTTYDVNLKTNNANRLKISKDGWIGIGTDTLLIPSGNGSRLNIKGDHINSKIALQSTGDGGVNDAYLELWASEPYSTFSGVGIGSNITSFEGASSTFVRKNKALGGSYIRMNQDNLLFHTVSNTGVNRNLLSLNTNGTIVIGGQTTIYGSTSVNGDIVAVENALISKKTSNEGGAIVIENASKIGAIANKWAIYNMTTAGYGDGLAFWRYNQNGSSAGRHFTLYDNGNAVLASGNFGAGIQVPTNKIHVVAISNPIRAEGLQAGASTDQLVTVDATGVFKQRTVSDVTNYSSYAEISSSTTYTAISPNITKTTGTITVTLPTASSAANKSFTFVKSDISTVLTIQANGSETINNANFITSNSQWDRITLFSTGTEWIVTGQ